MAKQSTNKTTYWIIGGILVVLCLGIGGYKLWHHNAKGSAVQYTNSAAPTTSTISQAQGSQATGKSGLPNKTDTNNQQLQQDTQDIQNSMNQLQQDQGTATQDTGSQAKDVPQQ